MDNIGDQYQLKTKYTPGQIGGRKLNWNNKPPTYKEYPDATTIKLGHNKEIKTKTLLESLKERKSHRHYKNNPLTPEELSFLLWASTGIERIEHNHEYRTAPSAGALYPIETYLVINNVQNIPEGIYHYNIKNHTLELLKEGNFKEEITFAALEQDMCAEAPVVFIWSAIFERSKWKYDQRAYRYIYLDAGHIAENLALAATSIDLGTCQIAALYDDVANDLLDIDGINESVIYMTVTGAA